MRSNRVAVLLAVTLALVLMAGVLVAVGGGRVAAQAPEPAAAPMGFPVEVQRTFTLYPPTAVTTGTVTTRSPLVEAGGRDAASTTGFATADVFVSVDGTGTFTLTAKVQVSPDGTTWVDYAYPYESLTSSWASEGVTSTATSTTAIMMHTPTMTFTADGAQFVQAALAGERLRVVMDVTGVVTPTVKVTYRN